MTQNLELSAFDYVVSQTTLKDIHSFNNPETKAIEAQGWEPWLMTMFPFAFEEEFSDDHRKFWELFWSLCMRIREQRKYIALGVVPGHDIEKQEAYFRALGIFIEPKEYVILLILGRGLAKSSTIEASAVVRGALLGGYCLYICEGQDQANEHIGNCKGIIEHEESRLDEFYPGMRIDPDAKVNGKKTKDREDLFITASGWICRAKGLNASLRGLRIGNHRPDHICLDDLDGVNDSIAVSAKKLKQVTASVIPTQARRHATIAFGQNLIVESGVMTQIYTGKSDALAERTTIGVSNTFVSFEEHVDYTTYFDEEDGRIKHRILPGARTTWKGVDTGAAQKFLNDSGLETFIAEYQNSFAHMKTGKVFHEWNEQRHIITWSMFEKIFGVRYIPADWQAKATADLGYSKESLSAWLFTASAAQNTPLPARYFCYRAKTFVMDGIDDQAIDIWEDMFPDDSVGKTHSESSTDFAAFPELFRLLKTKPRCQSLLENYTYNWRTNEYENKSTQPGIHGFAPTATEEEKALFYVREAEKVFKSQITIWTVSHEKTGEQKTLAKMYAIPVHKTQEFGATDGVAEGNHLLKGDYTRPHPFIPDRQIIDEEEAKKLKRPVGTWLLGCPAIFFIVDDNQYKAPKDDKGMKVFREQIAAQPWTQEKLTENGLTKTIPLKYQSDYPDSYRMFAAGFHLPNSTPLTPLERFNKIKPPAAHIVEGEIITPEKQMAIELGEEIAREQMMREMGLLDESQGQYGDYYRDVGGGGGRQYSEPEYFVPERYETPEEIKAQIEEALNDETKKVEIADVGDIWRIPD